MTSKQLPHAGACNRMRQTEVTTRHILVTFCDIPSMMRYQELNRTRLHTRWCRQRAPTTNLLHKSICWMSFYLYRSAQHFLHLSILSSPEDGTCIDESENSTRQYRLDTVAGTHNCGNCCCEKGPAHTHTHRELSTAIEKVFRISRIFAENFPWELPSLWP